MKENEPVAVWLSPQAVHVTPESDDPEHRLDGFCWCQPTYEDVEPDGRLYIHRRFIDGPVREDPNA